MSTPIWPVNWFEMYDKLIEESKAEEPVVAIVLAGMTYPLNVVSDVEFLVKALDDGPLFPPEPDPMPEDDDDPQDDDYFDDDPEPMRA